MVSDAEVTITIIIDSLLNANFKHYKEKIYSSMFNNYRIKLKGQFSFRD